MKIISFFITTMLLLSVAYAQIAHPRNQDFDPKPHVNPKNPFDYFGEMHNDGVKEIGDLLGWRRFPKDTLYHKTAWYMTKEGSKDYARMYNTQKDYFHAGGTRSIRFLDSMMLSQGANKSEIFYLNKLIALMDNATISSKESFYTEIKRLEDQVIADNNVTTDVETLLLASASVSRFSIEFWDGMAVSNPEVVGITATGGSSFESFAKVKTIAKADLVGAVSGALFGGIKGLLGGPGGALAGAGAGALGGAIGGSIASALLD